MLHFDSFLGAVLLEKNDYEGEKFLKLKIIKNFFHFVLDLYKNSIFICNIFHLKNQKNVN